MDLAAGKELDDAARSAGGMRMHTHTQPYPPHMEYDPNDGTLTCQGAHVATVTDVDELPCLDEEDDLVAIQDSIRATGRKLALAYNAHDDLLAALDDFLSAYEDGVPQCHCANSGHMVPAPCTPCRARDAQAKARGDIR